jgi:hypothetical protein
MIEVMSRDEFLETFAGYLAPGEEKDPAALDAALAVFAFDAGLDAPTASGPVDRDARREELERLAGFAGKAVASGELVGTGEPDEQVDPSGAGQAEFVDPVAAVAGDWDAVTGEEPE